MNPTLVLAVAIALGSLLLWSLSVVVHDMANRRRPKPLPDASLRAATPRPPRPLRWADSPPVVSPEFDDRFEELVDEFFGPDDPRRDDPWRRSA